MAHTYVNSTSNLAADAGTSIAASAQNHTSGNLIVVSAYGYGGGYPYVSSIADTAGNTYTRADRYTRDAAVCQEVWYAYNITGHASNVVTVTFNSSVIYRQIGVHQYSGGYISSAPLDVHSVGVGSGTALSCSAVTTNYANELMFAFFTINQTPTFTAGSGFANRQNTIIGQTEDNTDLGAAGSETATMTSSISGNWAGVCATFRASETVAASLLPHRSFPCRMAHNLTR